MPIEIFGTLLLLICIVFWCFFPITRNYVILSSKSRFGSWPSIFFCSVLAFGFICAASLINHRLLHIGASELTNWNSNSSLDWSLFPVDSDWDNFYAVISQFADPGNLPSAIGNSRLAAVILAFSGIFFLSGVLVSSLVSALNKKTAKLNDGLIHYSRIGLQKNKYVIIIGVNELTSGIIRQSLSRKKIKYVLVQTRQPVEQVRQRLDLALDKKEEKKIVYYFGERTSKEDIESLHPEYVDEVYVLGESLAFENEKDHDSFNIKCVELLSEHLSEGQELRCHVNFEYQGTFTAFKATHHYLELRKKLTFIPFNVHEIWAKKVLVDNVAIVPGKKKGELEVQRYLPIDAYRDRDQNIHYITKDNIRDNAMSVHVVIMGMNQMGTAFGVQTALTAHYPNFMADKNLRTTITFIDEHAVAEGEYFRGRFDALFNLCRYRVVVCDTQTQQPKNEDPFSASWTDPLSSPWGNFKYLNESYGNFMDIQWEFIQGNVASDLIKRYLMDITSDVHQTTTIVVCFNHPQQSIASSLYLPSKVIRQANQVIVYQQNSFDLLDKVARGEKDWKRYHNLFPFGMLDGAYTGERKVNAMAMMKHFLSSRVRKDESLMEKLKEFDNSLIYEIRERWGELGLIIRQSNIDMVESIPSKLRSLGIDYQGFPDSIEGFLKENPQLIEAMSYSEHLRWVSQKLIGGFRPLYETEKNEWDKTGDQDYFKRKFRAHYGICSNECLYGRDSDLHHKDEQVIYQIADLLRYNEWITVSESDKDSLVWKFICSRHKKSCFMKMIKPDGDVKCRIDQKDESIKLSSSFWIGDSPVTEKQWYYVTGKMKPKKYRQNYPVVNVSKSDIEDFLCILRKRTGLFFNLPTFKEWAYVARKSSMQYLYKNDKEAEKKTTVGKNVWNHKLHYKRRFVHGPRRVRAKAFFQKNDYGVYDMLGNVWEWTSSEVFGHRNCYYFCGGSWQFKEKECDMMQDYWSTYWTPYLKSDDLGFRLVWRTTVPSIHHSSENITYIDRTHWLKDKDNWVNIKAGFFVMGADNDSDELAEADESPRHLVYLKEFEICSVPVTQYVWNLVMETNHKSNPAAHLGADYPQTNVSFMDIGEFLDKLNQITGDEYEYRLPTEAEWEYAAKGGHTSDAAREIQRIFDENARNLCKIDITKIPLYARYAGSDIASDVAWFNENTSQPVRKKQPMMIDRKGLYDMSGNVWEWVRDYYQSDFYEECINRNEYKQNGYNDCPECTNETYSAHVFRGGSYLFDERECRCTRPNFWRETDRDDDLGFRLVRVKKSKQTNKK